MAFRRLGDLVGRYLGIGGATGDATNPLSVRGPGSLHDGDTGGHQVRVNKAASGDTASFLFQTGFSGRAEFGTIGNDDFELKVSADGSAFTQAYVVAGATGVTDFKQQPSFNGQPLYHTGNFTIEDYAPLASPAFTGSPTAAAFGKCEAYLNYDAYVVADTWTKVPVNVARHNDQNAFAAGMGRFTAPHSGVYLAGCGATCKFNTHDPIYMELGLSVDGAAPVRDRTTRSGDWQMVDRETSCELSRPVKLTAGQTVEAQVRFAETAAFVEANTGSLWVARLL